MPDNVTAPAMGLAFATDEVAGVHWPYAKLAFGADGSAVPVADADGARLPVRIGGTLPAFAETPAFTVSGTLPAFATTPTVNIGAAPTINVAGPLTDAQLRATALPVSGTITANAGTGTFAISAAALPLPTGAATAAAQTTTNNSLTSIDGKTPALVGGAVPVATQKAATTTRTYDFASGQRITTAGAGQVRSAAVTATEVLLQASVRGFFRVGDAAVAATVGAGSIPLAADEKFHLQITSGQFMSFIRDGATDGSLSIMPVAV